MTNQENHSLKVSENQRYFVDQSGEPFFYLADTAWELFHRLNREEAQVYFRDRADKGFTVIQAVIIAEHGGLTAPNPYGALPIHDLDPTKPNEDYFRHVDDLVQMAESYGLVMALLPTWGDKVRKDWGEGPEIFDAKNAYGYGRFLGDRYRRNRVIWVLGGDRSPVGYEDVLRAMADGLHAGDGGRHMISFHGADKELRGSSPFFHEEEWLNFNMFYSSHVMYMPVHEAIRHECGLLPTKPTLDSEPLYENFSVLADGSSYFKSRKDWDRVTRGAAHHMRVPAYWSVLAGAAGHTYGCHDMWQFYDGIREPINFANTVWQEAMHFPGAIQMGYMRQLIEARPWYKLIPDQSLIMAGQGEGVDHIQSARADDGSFILAYITTGNPVAINTQALSGDAVNANWFDPRKAQWIDIGEFATTSAMEFKPPKSGIAWDWVLVLDAV